LIQIKVRPAVLRHECPVLLHPVDLLATLCGPAIAGVPGGVYVGLLLAGAAGSVMHCATMCGPFVLGQVSDRLARVPAARLCERQRLGSALLVPYHTGRITTYAGLGALAGAGGAAMRQMPWLGWVSVVLMLFAALLFLGHALRRMVPALAWLLPGADRAPVRWVRLIRGLSARLDRTTIRGGWMLGVALGFLPCGFLYAALATAAATASPVAGLLAMVCFGLGTVPSLVAVGVAGVAAGRAVPAALSRLAPAVLLLNAAVLAVVAWERASTLV
jgi:sulfite exporter TauE/SafE